MKISRKQQKFADEYIKTGNAKQSAISAGYSKKSAEVTSSRMLRFQHI
ncbi:terminase small subunit [Staphylococcus pseudintermedius]|nr:terminase small subunit [Staphylococcus pseudintermedius]MDE9864442.1 terminase small subunit [Staphylococcus pseudintermedius]MDF0042145.1 terminase small subunit [Staphylococcus pseudintermedius]MDF0101067.1 terminase small subunit [Staphylococcus pseudintermedius]MDF0108749.1 terminase small subunit [Staphylococcus pseudintermedius]MDF0186297.1 terminase small subunit [Staphylococcus pseudintermedius]